MNRFECARCGAIDSEPHDPTCPQYRPSRATANDRQEGGVKQDGGKLRYDLIPPESMRGLAAILTFGAQKYAPRNWEQGIAYSRVYGALQRHLWAWWGGEDKDSETGESHLHHACCCIAFLQTFVEQGRTTLDDRPTHA